MNISKVEDDKINVEDIMRQIRKNIKQRKDGAHNDAYTEDMVNKSFQASTNAKQDELQQNLDYINFNWDLHADYYISTHRPIIGRFLVLGRQFIHGEVKRYVDLLVRKQSDFNMHVVATLNNRIKDIDNKINVAVENKINEITSTINKDIENKAWLSDLLDDKIKTNLTTLLPPEKTDNMINYFLFEDKFRGSTNDIKQRQTVYLKYFENCQNVLDIGCGRGEFLSLLKENDITAKGIDINEDMILYCKKNDLDVQKTDVFTYLQSIEDQSLDGIFLAQVIEHLQPAELIALIKLSYDKLQCGSHFVAETINPVCISAHEWFHMDLSHVKLIHPRTIEFLLESIKFRDIKFELLSPIPDELKLIKLDTSNETAADKAKYDLINRNIDNLNQLLYGNQDYAIVGKK